MYHWAFDIFSLQALARLPACWEGLTSMLPPWKLPPVSPIFSSIQPSISRQILAEVFHAPPADVEDMIQMRLEARASRRRKVYGLRHSAWGLAWHGASRAIHRASDTIVLTHSKQRGTINSISHNPIDKWGVRMKIKSSLWRFRYAGMDCAVDMRFAWAASEKEARAALTKKLKVRKLPQGTELWPEDDH